MSQTISQFPRAAELSLGDLFVVTQASTGAGTGVTKSATIAQIGSVFGDTPIEAVSSDFLINNTTLEAASSLARTSQTVPAVISSGTYDVTNIVSFTTAFVSSLLSIANTATFSCLGTATFNSIACSTGTIAAAGSTQATATVMTAQDCVVNSGTGGVELYPFGVGVEDVVRNRTTLTIEAYPPLGGQIEALGTNVAFAVGPGATNRFRQFSATQWYAS